MLKEILLKRLLSKPLLRLRVAIEGDGGSVRLYSDIGEEGGVKETHGESTDAVKEAVDAMQTHAPSIRVSVFDRLSTGDPKEAGNASHTQPQKSFAAAVKSKPKEKKETGDGSTKSMGNPAKELKTKEVSHSPDQGMAEPSLTKPSQKPTKQQNDSGKDQSQVEPLHGPIKEQADKGNNDKGKAIVTGSHEEGGDREVSVSMGHTPLHVKAPMVASVINTFRTMTKAKRGTYISNDPNSNRFNVLSDDVSAGGGKDQMNPMRLK
ncbi:hypothetical protein L6452_32686 [Arctium lappa]|uniref:Uncharacterized protein n=1 Tax=Arctium lappa TaxID=4217 RepID=A0ACB8Z5P1_ARCLA|nr:hypothetical protein L6452_32686 [Arctium lappa]